MKRQKNFIRRTREVLGEARGAPISQAELGEMIGRSRPQVQRYESRGLLRPEVHVLIKLRPLVTEAREWLIQNKRAAEAKTLWEEAEEQGI